MFFDNTPSGSSDSTFEGLGMPLIGGGDDETMGESSFKINWNDIINQAFGIGSQAISAYSGQNTGTQIGYNPQSQSVFAIHQNPRNFDDRVGGYPQTYTPQQYAAMQQGGAGATVGGGIDGIFNWLMANPVITFGGIAALYLLFKEPPRRR